jgi:ATP-binding cassette, subfamily C, bacterial CydC
VAPWLAGRAVMASERTAAEHRDARDDAVMTALEHADQLRVGGRLTDVITEVADRQTQWGRLEDSSARPAALAAATQTLAIGAAVVGAVLAGINLSAVTGPTTVAVVMLLPLSAFEATGSLPAAAVTLVRARLAAQRLTELISAPGDTTARVTVRSRTAAGWRLETTRLIAGFTQPTRGGPLDLDLRSGARLAVIGASGAGKTSLLMTLAGLLEPRDGVVALGGTPISALSENEIRSRITFFAEDSHIFATTVGDNLRVARGDATDTELLDALGRVGLAEWAKALPEGLATILVGGAEALSAGQRRRLLLARAVIVSSPIVLLDEPTENMDADDSDAFLRAILAKDSALFDGSRTVVVATHHLPPDVCCERLTIATDGRKNPQLSTLGPSAGSGRLSV